MNIQIRKIADELKISAPDLITRMNGRLIYEKVMSRIKNAVTDETVLLDLNSIKVMDASFIDELIVKTIKVSQNGKERFFLKLKNISSAAEINIDSVFSTYSYYNNEKIAVVTDEICKNNNFFIGSLSSVEKDILDYLRVNLSAGLRELVEFTGLAPDEVKRITDELFSLRMIKRTEDIKFNRI
jgi:DNA-binding Lrp family transcriptional regulator